MPEAGTYKMGVLVVAAAGFGSEHGIDGLMCRDFNTADSSSPDAAFPFEGTLTHWLPLRQMMFAATDATLVIFDTSPPVGSLLDLPQGIGAVGPSADDWRDEHSYAVSAAGPGKNGKVGLVRAWNTVLEDAEGSLTVRALRQKLRVAAATIDGSIVAYDVATGRFATDEDQSVFGIVPAPAPPTREVTLPTTEAKRPPIAPIVSFGVGAACLVGGGIMAANANAMYTAALADPSSYEGQTYADVVAQYDTNRYGALALGACGAVGVGLGATILLTGGANANVSLAPLGIGLSGNW